MNNRELKFRYYDEYLKSFRYSDSYEWPTNSEKLYYFFDHANRYAKDGIIQQYTGLKDSKGVEIFEGDVVKYNPDEPNTEREGIIEWCDYYHGWAIRDKQCYPESNYGVFSLASPFMSFNDVKIISHIFENPELIKNK